MKKKARIAVAAISMIAAAIAWFSLAGRLERARVETPLPGAAAPSGPAVDTAALMEDVRVLAAPGLAGRRTGSPGSKQAQAYIAKRFEQVGLQPFGASYVMPFSFTHTSIKGLFSPGKAHKTEYPSAANLVGFIKGSKYPDRYLVVSAHYDHLGTKNTLVYHGADDNASGIGAMLAVAAAFKASPPENTIVFAAFDSEELGKQGAKAFIAKLPFPRAGLVMNLNLDMVSRNDENQIWASGLYHYPALKPLVEAAARRSTLQVRVGHDRPMYLAGSVEDWTGSSDHQAFHEAGVPYVYFGVADHADYHQPTDTFDKINPVFFSSATSLLIDVARTADKNLSSIR